MLIMERKDEFGFIERLLRPSGGNAEDDCEGCKSAGAFHVVPLFVRWLSPGQAFLDATILGRGTEASRCQFASRRFRGTVPNFAAVPWAWSAEKMGLSPCSGLTGDWLRFRRFAIPESGTATGENGACPLSARGTGSFFGALRHAGAHRGDGRKMCLSRFPAFSGKGLHEG